MASERKIVADNLKRVLLKEYVMQETARAGFGGLDIQRTPMGTRITLFAERPGIVIGRRGASIKALTENVDRGFDLDNPQIEVEEVGNPALNAQIMAEKLASALERGWHFRRAGHSTLRRIMASGAKGALIRISGKLTSQRHRTEKFKAGHIKYNGEPKNLWVDQGFSTAKLKRGSLGITVWITDPNAKLPDEIEVVVAVEAPVEPPTAEIAPPTEAPSEAPPEAPPEREEAAPEEPPEVEAAAPEPAAEPEKAPPPAEPPAPEPTAAGSTEATAEDATPEAASPKPEEKPSPPPDSGKPKAAPKKKPAKKKASAKKPAKKKASAKKPAKGEASKKAPAAKKKAGAPKKSKEVK